MAGRYRKLQGGMRRAACVTGGALAMAVALVAWRGAVGQAVLLPPGIPQQGLLSDDIIVNDAADSSAGFILPKEDSKTLDKFEDFNRYVEKKAWAQAFAAFNSLSETHGTGMVGSKSGFMFPLRRRLAQSLAGLPAEGREAYRLFYDAEAKQLWDQVNVKGAEKGSAGRGKGLTGAEEMLSLQKIVGRYAMTSVGDLASDRLGDLLFERGDFGGAEACWRAVVQDFPDTHLQAAKLQVKRCVALSRMGRREELGALADVVREHFAAEKVTIGGEEVAAGDFVKTLLLPGASADVNSPAPAIDAIRIKPGALWRVQPILDDEKLWEKVDEQRNGMAGYFSSAIPGAALEGKRLYVNCLGMMYATDIETGKMLWKTGKFTELPQKMMTGFDYGVDPTHFSVMASGGRVYALIQETPNGNTGATLQCFNPAGSSPEQPVWKSDKLGVTSISLPLASGDGAGVGYCTAIQGDKLVLLALDLSTGSLEWRVELGKPQDTSGGGSYRSMMQVQEPSMVATSGMVYVSTNNRALLAVNTAQRQVEWAFHPLAKERGDVEFEPRRYYGQQPVQGGSGTLLLEQNTLYLKDAGGDSLYAIDPSGPAVKWERKLVDADFHIFRMEGSMAYLMGNSVAALDLNRREKLAWNQDMRLPNRVRPLVTRGHIYVSTAKGIEDIDLTDQAHIAEKTPALFRSEDQEKSYGGQLFLAGDELINVSNAGVTAYRVEVTGGAGGGANP